MTDKTAPSPLPKHPFFVSRGLAILEYKRTFGAFQETQAQFEKEYGIPFDHRDAAIPDAFKHYYRLVGLRQAIQDTALLDAIHEELALEGDYEDWQC